MNYRFGDCVLDVDRRELTRGTKLVPVEPQAFDLLVYLIENRGRVVRKDNLIAAVWKGRIVSDSALTTRINAARTAIGDSGKAQSLIRTYPRKGFRFVGEVREEAAAPRGPATAGGSPPFFAVRAVARASCVLMGEEQGALQNALQRGRNLVAAGLENAGGSILATPADTIVAIFTEAPRSVSAVAQARKALTEMNRNLPPEARVHYRFGVAGGDLLQGNDGPGGSAVERAAALGAGAHPDAIRIGENVWNLLPDSPEFATRQVEADEYELEGGETASPSAGLPAQLLASDPPFPSRPSIVLLPFKALGCDGGSEAFAEGLRLDIQNALTKMSGAFLVAAGSANAMRGWSAADAAARVGVRYVLEGVVQQSADRVRVSVQLVDTVAGTAPWSELYDRSLDEEFAIQDDITERIVTALDIKLASGEQARIWHKCLTNPGARECFYRGLHAFIRMNRESVASARVFFERLVEVAPGSPFGPTWIALCLWFESARGWAADPAQAREQAGHWAERAVALEDADGQAHTVLGNVRLLQGRFDEAMAVANEALEIRPGCANANGFLANVLLYCGEPDKAVLHARRAIRFMPVYPPWFVEILSASYRDAGMSDLGIIAGREAVRIAPTAITGRLVLATALVRSGWLADARRIVGELRELDASLNLRQWASSQPYRHADALAAAAEDLRAAGLQE